MQPCHADLTLTDMMVKALPNLFAMSYVDGDHWLAVWRAPLGRGFDRRELLPCEYQGSVDEGAKPPAQVNGNLPRRPRLRAFRVV
jgi:hypothetical protein